MNFDVYTVYVRVACSSHRLCRLDKLLVLDIRSAEAFALVQLEEKAERQFVRKDEEPFLLCYQTDLFDGKI